MFRSFFLDRRWMRWSLFGSLAILGASWFQVQLDVRINKWFGEFYDTLQQALGNPGTVEFGVFLGHCLTFMKIAAIYVTVAVIAEFFTRHYVFRWRTAMNDYYTTRWKRLNHIEGAAQTRARGHDALCPHHGRPRGELHAYHHDVDRIPATAMGIEPTRDGVALDWRDRPLPRVPGHPHRGGRNPAAGGGRHQAAGVSSSTFKKVEAAYRKELVLGEEFEDRADPPSVSELFGNIRGTYFRYYLHYFYFDIAKMVVPAIRGDRALHHARSDHRRRRGYPRRAAADPGGRSTGWRGRFSSWCTPGRSSSS